MCTHFLTLALSFDFFLFFLCFANVQLSMTLSGTQMTRTVFRLSKKSRVILKQNIGHSWVQVQKKRCMEVLTTFSKGNGIVQSPKWCNDLKKLVILYSKVSVFRVVESWRKKGNHSFQQRFYEPRNLVRNNSFCKSPQCSRSSDGVVFPIR